MVRIGYPSLSRVKEAEEDFDELLHEGPWIGSPERSVEMMVFGKYSRLITESFLSLDAHIPEAQVLASFRGISNEDFKDLISDNFKQVKEVDSDLKGNKFFSEADRLHMIYEELDVYPTSNNIFNVSFNEMEQDFENAALFEKGLTQEGIEVLEASLVGSGRDEYAAEAYQDLQEDLCFKIDFKYNLGSLGRSNYHCTAYFDSGDIELDIRGEMELAISAIETHLREIYQDQLRDGELDSVISYEK